jgi:hypothetical protein
MRASGTSSRKAVVMPVSPLTAERKRLLDIVRRTCPDLLPADPVGAGTVVATIPVNTDQAQRLFVPAAAAAAGIDPIKGDPKTLVKWREGDRELVIVPAAVRVQFATGVIAVSIPCFCDQTQAALVHVSFAVGDPKQPAGLIAATDVRPRGPAIIVDAWGDALVAYAWHIVLEVVAGVAGEAGRDVDGSRLVPIGLGASGEGMFVVPMARHTFDRERS